MPKLTIPAQKLTTWRGYSIYRTYHDDDLSKPHRTQYALHHDGQYGFNIRDLPVPIGIHPAQHALIAQSALDNGIIPRQLAATPDEPVETVMAMVETLDGVDHLHFNALDWVLDATDGELLQLANEGFEYTDAALSIAMYVQHFNYQLAGFIAEHSNEHLCCSIDVDRLLEYLNAHDKRLAELMESELGLVESELLPTQL